MSPSASGVAVVVLGCRLRWSADGWLLGAGGRRVRAAVRHLRDLDARGDRRSVMTSGGRSWGGQVEADALAAELVRWGVDDARIERERLSWSTRENARFVAERLGPGARVALVTCDWHLPRAASLFRGAGLSVEPVAATPEVPPPLATRIWHWGRERMAARLDGV